MAWVREVVSVRAAPLGQKSSRIAASHTRRRVSSLTRALSLMTRETVAMETPDARATSRIVVTIDPRLDVRPGKNSDGGMAGVGLHVNVYTGPKSCQDGLCSRCDRGSSTRAFSLVATRPAGRRPTERLIR